MRQHYPDASTETLLRALDWMDANRGAAWRPDRFDSDRRYEARVREDLRTRDRLREAGAVRVTFRILEGEPVAFLPDVPADPAGNVTCYARVGQHAAADPALLDALPPAGYLEYRDLLSELRAAYAGDTLLLEDAARPAP